MADVMLLIAVAGVPAGLFTLLVRASWIAARLGLSPVAPA
jgi:hypothetical protein